MNRRRPDDEQKPVPVEDDGVKTLQPMLTDTPVVGRHLVSRFRLLLLAIIAAILLSMLASWIAIQDAVRSRDRAMRAEQRISQLENDNQTRRKARDQEQARQQAALEQQARRIAKLERDVARLERAAGVIKVTATGSIVRNVQPGQPAPRPNPRPAPLPNPAPQPTPRPIPTPSPPPPDDGAICLPILGCVL